MFKPEKKTNVYYYAFSVLNLRSVIYKINGSIIQVWLINLVD